MLHRALSRLARSLTISFSRQYPGWMYPGRSDRDESLLGYVEPSVEYLIDSLNPASWARAIARMEAFKPETVVFPWWHTYWTPSFAWMARAARARGIEVVFLCHNSLDHEGAAWKQWVSSLALSAADRFVVHTQSDRQNIASSFKVPVQVHPHPTFDGYPGQVAALPRRARLELLFFGFVRPYKGLDTLLNAMSRLRDADVFLSIVGEFWQGESEARRYVREHMLEGRVEFVSRYVSDEEAAAFFTRCDVVVLPYHSATGSGVIPLAYQYGKPVLASRIGGLPDVVMNGRTGILLEPGDPVVLGDAIINMLEGRIRFDLQAIESMRSALTWEGLALEILRGPADRSGGNGS